MGSSPTKRSDGDEKIFSMDGKCSKHTPRIYTHYCEETGQLMCLTCYQEYKRFEVKRGTVSCVEIEGYSKSFHFKQQRTQAEELLRQKKKKLEEEISEMDGHCRNLKLKGDGVVEAVTSYVDRVVELLKHLSRDLCRQTVDLMQRETEIISSNISELHYDITRLDNLIKKLNRTKSKPLSPEVQVSVAVKANTFAHDIKLARFKTEQIHVDLSLNKALKLQDIIDATNVNPAKLGTVRLEKVNDCRQQPLDVVSEISEDTSEFHAVVQAKGSPENRKEELSKSRLGNTTTDNSQDFENSARCTDIGRNFEFPQESSLKHGMESTMHKTTVSEGTRQKLVLHHRHSTPALSPCRRSTERSQSRIVRSSLSRISPLSPTTPSGIVFSTPHNTAPLWTRRPVKVQEITLPPDHTTCNITGSLFLNDGKIILADQKNTKLKLFDVNFDLLDEIRLPGQPHNIAIDESGKGNIAVTLPASHIIKFLEVTSGRFVVVDEEIHTGPQCWGVEFISGKLTYTTDKDAIFRREGQGFLKFPYSFSEPVSLFTNPKLKTMYIACNGLKCYSGSIVAMDFSGDIKFTYSNKDLKHPVSVALDSEGNVYVADREPHAVHLITADGLYGKVILTQENGLFQHIRFFPDRDVFLVSEKDSDKITIYEMQ